MKNKNKTYLLLAAVLAVWGTITFKMVNGLSPNDKVVVQEDVLTHFSPNIEVTQDTFSIQSVTRDPFLGILAIEKSNKTKTSNLKKRDTTSIPKIIYGGLVKNQKTSEQVFVVTINNSQYLLKRGQIVQDIELIKGNAKSIVVSFNKKTQTIQYSNEIF